MGEQEYISYNKFNGGKSGFCPGVLTVWNKDFFIKLFLYKRGMSAKNLFASYDCMEIRSRYYQCTISTCTKIGTGLSV